MSKKQKQEANDVDIKPLHLLDLSDALTSTIQFLTFFEIHHTLPTSKEYAERCKKALKGTVSYDCKFDEDMLGPLLRSCPNLTFLGTSCFTSCSMLTSAIIRWPNLEHLSIRNSRAVSCVGDIRHQYSFIPLIASNLPNLKFFFCQNAFSIGVMDFKPLLKLKHFRDFHYYCKQHTVQRVTGLVELLKGRQVRSLGVDGHTDLHATISVLSAVDLKKLSLLRMIKIQDLPSALCFQIATKCPFLFKLECRDGQLTDDGIQHLVLLRYVKYLLLNMGRVTNLGISYLCKDVFPVLKEFTFSNHDSWNHMEILMACHANWKVKAL